MAEPITDPELLAQLNGKPVSDPALLAQLNGGWTKKPFTLADTWPARVAKSIYSAVTLPGDVMAGKAQLPSRDAAVPGSVPYGDPNSAGERVADLAMLASPINPAVRAGDAAIPGVAKALIAKPVEVPTAETLKATGKAGFENAKATGLEIAGPAVKRMSETLQSSLEKDGIIEELAPTTFKIISKLQSPPEGAVATVSGLHAARQALSRAATSITHPAEKAASARAIEAIDGLITKVAPKDVVAGDAAAAGAAFTDALGNYSAAMRSGDVGARLTRAERQAAKSGSGSNIDNAIRQKISAILDSKNGTRGYTADEIAQMERVVRGSAATNAARKFGKLGFNDGLTMMAHAAAAVPSMGISIPIGAAATGSRKIAEALTQRGANKLDEMIRMRSPLYEAAKAAPEMTAPSAASRAAIIRALLLSAEQSQR